MNCYWSEGLRKARERAQTAGIPRLLPAGVVEYSEYLLVPEVKRGSVRAIGLPKSLRLYSEQVASYSGKLATCSYSYECLNPAPQTLCRSVLF